MARTGLSRVINTKINKSPATVWRVSTPRIPAEEEDLFFFFLYESAPLQSTQKLNHPVIEMKTKEREEENKKEN